MSNEVSPALHRKLIRHLGMYRFSMAGLLVALVVLLVASPFMEMLAIGQRIEAVLMTLVLISAVQAVGNRQRTLLWAGVLMLPAVVGKWLNHLWPHSVPLELFLISTLVFLVFIIVQLLRFILTSPRVNGEVLCASVSTYLLLGMLWAFAYQLVSLMIPGAFVFNDPGASRLMGKFTSLYFSFVTLSTVGYGDIVPVSNVARMLSALEAVAGSMFIGVLIARLVSLYSAEVKK